MGWFDSHGRVISTILHFIDFWKPSDQISRCRIRKIACDGIQPACSSCTHIDLECRTSAKLRGRTSAKLRGSQPTAYTTVELERRIESLEARVRKLEASSSKSETLDSPRKIETSYAQGSQSLLDADGSESYLSGESPSHPVTEETTVELASQQTDWNVSPVLRDDSDVRMTLDQISGTSSTSTSALNASGPTSNANPKLYLDSSAGTESSPSDPIVKKADTTDVRHVNPLPDALAKAPEVMSYNPHSLWSEFSALDGMNTMPAFSNMDWALPTPAAAAAVPYQRPSTWSVFEEWT